MNYTTCSDNLEKSDISREMAPTSRVCQSAMRVAHVCTQLQPSVRSRIRATSINAT